MTGRRRLQVGLALLVALWLGVGWYYASQALAPGGLRMPEFNALVVSGPGDGRIVLPDSQDARLEAVGLLYAGGYARLSGDVVEVPCGDDEPAAEDAAESGCLARDFTLITGVAPEQAATMVDVDEYAFAPGDPTAALGVDVQTLSVAVPGGNAPAWWVPPTSSDVVVVLVHGRGASRDEMLRLAKIVHDLGHGVLIPTHRGDGVAPEPEDGLGRFGSGEWLDVALAMLDPAVPKDARFVLAGNSQGGAAVASLLAQADVADRVGAVILDSPLIGLDATMQLQARLEGIPNVLVRPVLTAAYLVSRIRGFNFADGEHVAFLAGQERPILLFHGPDDTFVPVGPSDRLAEMAPDLVTYVRIPGVDHVRFWNHDPGAYAAAVSGFLAAHLG